MYRGYLSSTEFGFLSILLSFRETTLGESPRLAHTGALHALFKKAPAPPGPGPHTAGREPDAGAENKSRDRFPFFHPINSPKSRDTGNMQVQIIFAFLPLTPYTALRLFSNSTLLLGCFLKMGHKCFVSAASVLTFRTIKNFTELKRSGRLRVSWLLTGRKFSTEVRKKQSDIRW